VRTRAHANTTVVYAPDGRSPAASFKQRHGRIRCAPLLNQDGGEVDRPDRIMRTALLYCEIEHMSSETWESRGLAKLAVLFIPASHSWTTWSVLP
jgi:hypothetical protein